jgi:BON domain
VHEAVEKRIEGPRQKAKMARLGIKVLATTARAGYRSGRGTERARATSRRLTNRDGVDPLTPVAFGVGLAGGAIACYFLDPQQGRRRRHEARDRVLSIGRRGFRRAEQRAARAARGARGRVMRVAHRNGHPEELDDASLADKVRSEALRDHEVPKGQVNVNVEHGTVVLRGQLASQEQIDHLIAEAERVDGVREVKSLLHTP